MNKEWTVHVDDLAALNLGQEVELVIKSMAPGPSKYESHRVLGVVTKGDTSKGDRLWVRSATGVLYLEDYWIRIKEERKLIPTRF